MILSLLPPDIGSVYSSPLRRCTRLARHLFPEKPLFLRDDLMEIYCGSWEMRAWDELPREEIDPWMADFLQVKIPGGESYVDLHRRVGQCWETILQEHSAHGARTSRQGFSGPAADGVPATDGTSAAIIAHGGVIRSILAGITGTPLIDSFKAFALHYGCVIRVFRKGDSLDYEVLSNPPPKEKEQHKPASFYSK